MGAFLLARQRPIVTGMTGTVKFTVWRVLTGVSLLAVAALPVIVFSAPDPEYRWAQIRRCDRLHGYDATIEEVARQANLEPALVKAIAWEESRLQAHAQTDGVYGLMQIGSAMAREWAASQQLETFLLTDLFDARTNLQAGTWYLRRAFDRWRDADDPVVFALADYAAGPESLRRWSADSLSSEALLRAIDVPEVQQFVARVQIAAHRFQQHGL